MTMAGDDYYTHLARQQLQRLNADRAQTLANLENAKSQSDYELAGDAVQQLADIEAKKQNLISLHDQYVRSQTPVEPPEPTPEERHAKPIERMDYGDVWEMCKNSKHGVDEDGFRAGMAEVARQRRARGE